jgi:hypothetical protein
MKLMKSFKSIKCNENAKEYLNHIKKLYNRIESHMLNISLINNR